MILADAIADIEERRDSRVVVLAASHLDLDLLPMLYDRLEAMGDTPRLDIVLQIRGGAVDSARRIGLLLADATAHLGAIVPDRCQSSGTIVALAAHEIVAGPCAIFSPVDPALQGPVERDSDGPGAVSTEDIRRFAEMAREWFGQEGEQASADAIAALSSAIFPPTLTAFYRATCEVESICRELIGRRLGADTGDVADRIVTQLMHGYHSHGFPLAGDDLANLGLPVVRDAGVETSAWRIAGMLRSAVGGGARDSERDDWFDACIATRDTCHLRRTGPHRMMPCWEAGTIGG